MERRVRPWTYDAPFYARFVRVSRIYLSVLGRDALHAIDHEHFDRLTAQLQLQP
jgi:hypothetical protein